MSNVKCQMSNVAIIRRTGLTKINIILLIVLSVAVIIGIFTFLPIGFKAEYVPRTELPKIDGLNISALKSGTGPEVKGVETVVIKYRGLLKDGTEFAKPTQFEFKFGSGNVLKIWEDGIKGMKVGEVRRLEIDPKLAYGEQGIPNMVPPNSTVIFEIELVSIGNETINR